MARNAQSGSRTATRERARTCTATLEVVRGRRHDFSLVLERPEFGVGRRLDYWNMDGRGLRGRNGGRNGRAVVELWRDLRALAGGTDEADAIHYLLARAHLRFAHGRAVHDVYNAAHLGRCADREYALPGEDSERLRLGLERGGPGFVQSELERLFLRHERMLDERGLPDRGGLPDEAELPAYDWAFSPWIAPGLVALHRGDEPGVEGWLDRVAEQCRDYQRRSAAKVVRGTSGRARRFANAFQYECLARFHACLADVWGVLIPRLERFQGLDALGARFLDLMHQVHRPEDLEARLGRRRGVLCGYPLALHPVGRWILGQPRHLDVVVDWLEHPDYDALCATGGAWDCPAYRRFLHTILCTASECAAARRQDDTTGRAQRTGARAIATQSTMARPPVGQDVARVLSASPALSEFEQQDLKAALEQHAVVRKLACPDCQGSGRLDFHEVSLPRSRRRAASSVNVTYACPRCRKRVRVGVRPDDLRAAFQAQAIAGQHSDAA